MNSAFRIVLLLLVLNSCCSLKASQGWIGKYIQFTPVDSLTNYDYHNIQFYMLPYNLDGTNTVLGDSGNTNKLKIGKDNRTYPSTEFIVNQTDLNSGVVTPSIQALENFIPGKDLYHKKCYVAWDITKLNPETDLAQQQYYDMKIKFFRSLSKMEAFYSSIATGYKISQCDQRPVRFMHNFNRDNESTDVIHSFPFSYFTCLPYQKKNSEGKCEDCPIETLPSSDISTCVEAEPSTTFIYEKVNPLNDQSAIDYYSIKVRAYPGYFFSKFLYDRLGDTNPKIRINNSLTNSERDLIETNVAASNTYTTITTLATFPFSPEIQSQFSINLSQACTNLIPSVFPVRWAEYVYLEDNKIMVDFRYGMRNGSIYLCYPWYDKDDFFRSSSWLDFGKVTYNTSTQEHELQGYYTQRSGYVDVWLAPQNMMDEWNNYFWPGDSYVSIDVYMKKSEWNDGDGFTYIVANNGKATGIINFTTNFIKLGGVLYATFEPNHTNTSIKPLTQTEVDNNYLGTNQKYIIDDSLFTAGVWLSIKVLIENNAGVLRVKIQILNGATVLNEYTIPANPALTISDTPADTVVYGSRFMRFVYIKKGNATETVGQLSHALRVKNLKKVEARDPNSATLSNSACRTAKYFRTYFLYAPIAGTCGVGYQDHYLPENEKYGNYLPRYKDLDIDYTQATRKKTHGF